ncbi:MAG: small multi-drug export protein [Treponema sp.]|jgi:uncharacterized membrane protein|nr:small multi-drug export protein [Treponema sp.]
MSAITSLLWTAFLSVMPISELRGAIPFAMAHGIPWYWAYPFATAMNALAAPLCWIFLSTLHQVFLRLSKYRFFRWYRSLFDRFVERSRGKLRKGVEHWGWLGIALFVAVPLPITGAWTGTLGAWVLGLRRGPTMLAVILGVLIAGAIVTIVSLLGIQALDLFIKQV